MSNWLRNIQGQLSDLANEVMNEANEVLNEAREEVQDPETEIHVAKRNEAEAARKLAIEVAKIEKLEAEKRDIEQQLYDSHIEMDQIGAKFNLMIKQRDDEIKQLKCEIQQIQDSGWNNSDSGQIEDLQKEILHWKSMVSTAKSEDPTQNEEKVTKIEFERKIEEMRQKKEQEIQSLIETHADNVAEMREMYEEKMQSLQILQYTASSSTSNADTLDAVLLEKEELLQSSENLAEIKEKSEIFEEENANLKEQNNELTQAYNDLNEEFERFKRENAVVEVRNADLNNRIDSLKANLIEYEERYELSKRENMETVGQLEKLSADFEKLRSGIANVSQRRENCDTMVNEEVEKLRHALDESRSERERLREDVHRFQEAVGEIDKELEKLRESNHKLIQENVALNSTVATYDTTMKDIISNSEKDIGEFREQFRSIQESHRIECDRVLSEINSLRDENASLKRQNEYMTEESGLLREVNEKLKAKSGTEDTKAELLEKKIELLEHLRTELSIDLDEKRAEIADLKQKLAENPENAENLAKNAENPPKLFKNDTEMLEAQLSEALKANTEKSEECEEMRSAARNLEREIEVRQNCIDEMISQTNSLQLQQQMLTQENQELTNELLAKDREYLRCQQQLIHEQEKSGELAENLAKMEKCILDGKNEEQNEGNIESMKLYIEEIKRKYEEQTLELIDLKSQFLSKNEELEKNEQILRKNLKEAEEIDRNLLEGIEKRVVELEEEMAKKEEKIRNFENNEEDLKKLLMEKHEESMGYYQELEKIHENRRILEEQLKNSSEQLEKRGKEFERLKEHLMIVEENSTREAVESEQRETELRQRVRELEASGNAQKMGASETTQQLQINIEELMKKLENVEKSREEWKEKYEMEEKARQLTAEQLHSLQNVVHELSIDHETDKSQSSHRNLELQTEIRQLKEELEEIRENLERKTLGKQAAEEENERKMMEIEQKQRIIEQLENQIEELRAPSSANSTSKKPEDSYRIDDQTLRQLFLNYFMAEPSKRADIALLLASILEYPKEEMEKFRSAVKQSFGPSFFGSNSSPNQKSTLTEQFIRFLEVESESSKTAGNLPLRQKTEPPLKISMDNSAPQTSSSSANLDSLLR